jgi:hypothetical protein
MGSREKWRMLEGKIEGGQKITERENSPESL